MMRRRALLPALSVLVALAAACTSTGDETMFAPATTQAPPETAAPPTTAAPRDCENNNVDELRSYAPTSPLPAPSRMPAGSFMAEIQANGRLVVGVSADTLLFGARNPISGKLEGFDIDMVKQVALAIFGGELSEIDQHIDYRVITYAQRIPSLQNGSVDLVAHTMTINCARWQQIAFSSQYFDAGQKVLVRTDNGATTVDQLGGQRICVASGSTNIKNIEDVKAEPAIVVDEQPDLTDCLVKFQQGSVDGITGDDTVLAGFVAQDPYAKVLPDKFSFEPYGLGINQAHPEFVQFVNAVLERMRSDTTWVAMYDVWVGDALGPELRVPPPALYGRQP
jgi:polar amino acid transport system substrate-binding protein